MQDLAHFIANHMALTYTLAITLIALMAIELLRARRRQFNIHPAAAVQLINRQNAVLIDIRSNENYKKGHIVDAYSFSSQDLMKNTKPIEKFKKRPVVVVCGAGVESQKMAAFLLQQGYNAYSLAGGMRAWGDAELPIVKES